MILSNEKYLVLLVKICDQVTYTPFRGFPGYYYPYRNQRGYLSPIVMVQLKSPEPGVLMNIECTVGVRS